MYALHSKRHAIQKLQLLSECMARAKRGNGSSREEVLEPQHRPGRRNNTPLCKGSHMQHEVAAEVRGMPASGEPPDLAVMAAKIIEEDPILAGLSPLYQEYESIYWWFEVPKFVVTVILCGLVPLFQDGGASAVYISMVVTTGTLVLFANCQPYINVSDNVLAQFCQISLTFALGVGILEKADKSFQNELYGSVLVAGTATNMTLGLGVIGIDLLFTIFPDHSERTLAWTNDKWKAITQSSSTKARKRLTVVSPGIESSSKPGQETKAPESAASTLERAASGLRKASTTNPRIIPATSGPSLHISTKTSKTGRSRKVDLDHESEDKFSDWGRLASRRETRGSGKGEL
jgi:hypothetical protein